MTMKRVRNVLFWSSIDGSSTSSTSSKCATARITVALNVRSMSRIAARQNQDREGKMERDVPSWTFSCTSTVASFPSFFEVAEGRASTLSLPLVPHETSCRLQKAVHRFRQ